MRFEMKFMARILLLLAALAITPAYSQTVQHIVVVIQENRTPDNFFQDPKLIGADIAHQGACGANMIPLRARPLSDCYDLDHYHNPGWLTMYDGGKMDGACRVKVIVNHCHTRLPRFPQYVYVDNSKGDLSPYFQIAEQYGYANYMFQSNQGPSFPAHQFLFTGTSAPNGTPPQRFYNWFADEDNNNPTGCLARPSNKVEMISPAGKDESVSLYPCFEHRTMSDLLDDNLITWKYYAKEAGNTLTAPNAISHICQASKGRCQGPDWTNTPPNVVIETRNNLAPFLSDLANCKLAQVTWLTPDGRWSDHPTQSIGLGPDYTADIVNGIGQSGCTNPDGTSFWNSTVILIVWDDWGGPYDHVPPFKVVNDRKSWGSGYVYGFRVPLLVVSAYAKKSYISGALPGPGEIYPYVHDFGSILKFIENTFGIVDEINLLQNNYPFADHYAPDAPNSLADFFDYTQKARQFSPITLTPNKSCTKQGCSACDAQCLIHWKGHAFDPDDDATEN
jgi:phospholipase C